MLPHLAHRSRAVFVIASALSGLVLTGPAAAQGAAGDPANACDQATLQALIVERDSDASAYFDGEFRQWASLNVICRDFNGDAIPDALWDLSGGGSGGSFHAGIALSGAGETPATMAAWEAGRSHLLTGVHKRRAVIAWPKYRYGDANCCPSRGMRWRVYSAGPNATIKASKVHKTKKLKLPFKLKRK